MRRLVLVLVGGFCGTLARVLGTAPLLALATHVLPGDRVGFLAGLPADVLAINLSGALVLGLLYGLAERGAGISPDVRLMLGVGFLGAYTTFSSLAYGGDTLLRSGAVTMGALYLVGSVALGVLFVRLGDALAAELCARWRGHRGPARVRWARQHVRRAALPALSTTLASTLALALAARRRHAAGHATGHARIHPHTLAAPPHHHSAAGHSGAHQRSTVQRAPEDEEVR